VFNFHFYSSFSLECNLGFNQEDKIKLGKPVEFLIRERVWSQTEDLIWESTKKTAWYCSMNGIWDSIRRLVWDSVGDLIRRKIGDDRVR